jgi:hypothetical protein
MAAMNAVLHGFDQSPIVRRDSICGGEDKWDEVQFDVILENPPFSGQRGDAKRSLRVEKGDKYVLFLAAALRSLRPGGRAGIVFPTGILFGNSNSHIEVKKRLLAECDLQAVVTLPNGMFAPYTPNPTCFLIFQKTGKPTKETWFYRVQGDGSSLKTSRKFGPQFRNDFPDLLKKWPKRQTADGMAWRVPAEKIIANGYKMSLSDLGLVEPEKTDHAEPEEILSSVVEKEQKILDIIRDTRRLVMDKTINVNYQQLLNEYPKKRLGECGEVVGGGTPSKADAGYWNGNIPWVTAKEMWEFDVMDTSLKITERAVKETTVKLLPPGSVLFVVRGSILFKRVPISVNRIQCTINQDMKAIVPIAELNGDFLAHMLWGANGELKGMVDTAGNSAGKLPTERWETLPIPIPPLKVQGKIIARLTALREKMDELQGLRQEVGAELASFSPALLAKAVRGEL